MQSAETKQVMNSVLVDMPPEFIICNFQVKLFSNEECDYVLQLILVEISPPCVEPLFLVPMTLVELSHIFIKSVLVFLKTVAIPEILSDYPNLPEFAQSALTALCLLGSLELLNDEEFL